MSKVITEPCLVISESGLGKYRLTLHFETLNQMHDYHDFLLTNEADQLKKAAARYEYLRRLDPNKFAALWQKNIMTGQPFDELVDEAIERESLC